MPSRTLIRTIKYKNYSRANKRFRHQEIFEPYGDGISVFIEECALAGASLCAHISRFYPNTVDNPVFYWKISEEELLKYENMNEIRVEQSESAPNADGDKDECHSDITLDDVKSEKFRKARRDFAQAYCQPPNLFVCIQGHSHQLTAEEYENLDEWVKERGLVES